MAEDGVRGLEEGECKLERHGNQVDGRMIGDVMGLGREVGRYRAACKQAAFRAVVIQYWELYQRKGLEFPGQVSSRYANFTILR